jgi:hypothetical protein
MGIEVICFHLLFKPQTFLAQKPSRFPFKFHQASASKSRGKNKIKQNM